MKVELGVEAGLCMKYIIAEPDMQNGIELKKILDGFEIIEFQGSFSSIEEAEAWIGTEPPDVAFIRMGKIGLNAFRLVCKIREINRFSKVILLDSCQEYAVEAFEYGVDGFY